MRFQFLYSLFIYWICLCILFRILFINFMNDSFIVFNEELFQVSNLCIILILFCRSQILKNFLEIQNFLIWRNYENLICININFIANALRQILLDLCLKIISLIVLITRELLKFGKYKIHKILIVNSSLHFNEQTFVVWFKSKRLHQNFAILP